MTTWRTHGVDTVAALVEPKALKGLTRSVTAGPNEVAVITRDGEIADVFTEGKAATRGFVDLLRSMVSRGPQVRVFIAQTSPFTLQFQLESPKSSADTGDRGPFRIPALTADGQLIAGEVNLTLSVVAEDADRLLSLLTGRDALTTPDVARVIRDEALAGVIRLEMGKHSATDFPGNEEILRSAYEAIRVNLDATFAQYGIRLVNFSFFGFTQDELDNIGPKPPSPDEGATPAERVLHVVPPIWVFRLILAVGFLVAVPLTLVVLLTRDKGEQERPEPRPPPITVVVPAPTAVATRVATAAVTVTPIPRGAKVSARGFVRPDGTLPVRFDSPGIGIKQLVAVTTVSGGEFEIEIEQLDRSGPPLNRDTYQYLQVRHPQLPAGNVTSVTIRFAVARGWLTKPTFPRSAAWERRNPVRVLPI